VIKVILSGISFFALAACTQAPQKFEGINFTEYLNLCSFEVDDQSGCESLHDQKIVARGVLYLPSDTSRIELYSEDTLIPKDDNTDKWDDEPEDSLTLILTDDSTENISDLRKLHGETVLVNGTMNTDCITKYRVAQEKAELEQKNKSSESDDKIIVRVMLTGFCHCHSAYAEVSSVNEIEK